MKKIALFILLCLTPLMVFAGSKDKETEICNDGENVNNYLWSAIEIERFDPQTSTNIYSSHAITVYNFRTKENLDAYCIHPGKKAAGVNKCKTYWLKEEFLSEGCENSLDSFDCGLAAILNYANNKENEGKYDYVEVLTALRLWNAAHAPEAGDGWWTDGGVTSKRYIYTETANYIMTNPEYNGHGFWKLSKDVVLGVLFQDERVSADNYNQIDDSFNLYKLAEEGLPVYASKLEAKEKAYSFDKNGESIVTLVTNFSSETTNIEITSSSPAVVTNISTLYSCDDNMCIDVKLHVSPDELETCDTLDLELEVSYEDPNDATAKVKKYETNNDEYQTFVVYDKNAKIKRKVVVEISCEICDSSKKCCPGDTYETNKLCGKCSDNVIKYDIPSSCDGNTSDTIVGTIKDPELCTVISNEKQSNKYLLEEISYKYNGSKDLCSVFCREEYEFRFMGKEEAIAGRTFKYSVKGNQLEEANKYLTVVVAKRECTSKNIDYDTWKSDFNKLNNEILNAWNEWKYYESRVLKEKSGGTHKETITCPACPSQTCLEWGWRNMSSDPEEEDFQWAIIGSYPLSGTSAQKISWTWYSWDNAGYYKTNINGSSSYINSSGTSGSASSSYSCPSCDGVTALCAGSPGTSAMNESSKWQGLYEGYLKTREKMIDALENCNYLKENGVKSEILNYEYSSNVEYEYDDFYSDMTSITSQNSKTTTEPNIKYCDGYNCNYDNLCSDCDSEIENNINSSIKYEELVSWECSGSEGSSKCQNKRINVPASKYAYISTTTEEGYYQENKYYTQLYTGTVSLENNGNNYVELEDEENQTDYLFPIELAKSDGEYKTTLSYKNINEKFRKSLGLIKIKNIEYMCSIKVVNETVLCEGACSENKISNDNGTLGFIFRPIDMSVIFPNEIRKKGRNWANSQSIIDAIQNLSENFWSEVKPEYSITLTPAQIRKIKEYNSTRNYLDYSVSCKENGIVDPSSCKSTFLSWLGNNSELFTIKSIETDKYGNSYLWKKANIGGGEE